MRGIDWEYGAVDGVVGIDLVHFLVNTALLIDRRSTQETRTQLMGFAKGTNDLPSFGLDEMERCIVIVTSLLFDVATGSVATRGVESDKLELAHGLVGVL